QYVVVAASLDCSANCFGNRNSARIAGSTGTVSAHARTAAIGADGFQVH
ncbi:hypothetical protein A2U01_0112195, partial [Trifolium medium]|nr:hypothetical protein [Trifolium medium]